MPASLPLDHSGGASYAIPDLVSLAGEGTIRVPIFQRQFVWDSKNVRDLFDSIYRGFPVGTLLLWRHSAPRGVVQIGPVTLDVPENTNALWVVDGQQRITSLFASLSTQHDVSDERFDIYFDLSSQRFVNGPRSAVTSRYLPVREALETRSLLNWLRRNGDDLDAGDFDVADRLGGALRDYRIPAYIVSGEDQALLREVFDRVNSAGKPISRAQVFHALFASEEQPGSPASVNAALAGLGFGDIDDNRIVQTVLAIRGGDVQRDIHDEFSASEAPIDWYDKAQEALGRSIRYLQSEGIVHELLMPNTLPLPVLATFFYVHPDAEPWSLRLLSRWLWRGWTHGYGREGGQTSTLRRAIRSINPHHLNRDGAPTQFEALGSLLEYIPDRPTPRVDLHGFKTNYATSRLILLAMASRGPLSSDGSPIDIADQLRRHGVAAITEFVAGYRTNAAARGFWPIDEAGPVEEVDDSAILMSHLIDARAAQALREGDAHGFVAAREQVVADVTYNYLDSRTDPQAVVRPSINDLAEMAEIGDRA